MLSSRINYLGMLHCKKCTKPRDHLNVLDTVFLILSKLITISISFTSFHLTFTFCIIHIKKHICISHGINVISFDQFFDEIGDKFHVTIFEWSHLVTKEFDFTYIIIVHEARRMRCV